jgi:hypothetical protein
MLETGTTISMSRGVCKDFYADEDL